MAYEFDYEANRSLFVCFTQFDLVIANQTNETSLRRPRGHNYPPPPPQPIAHGFNTIGEVFRSTANSSIFHEPDGIIEFMAGEKYCFVKKRNYLNSYVLDIAMYKSYAKMEFPSRKIHKIYFMFGEPFPKYNPDMFSTLESPLNVTQMILFTHFFNISRLPKPYTDHCFEYSKSKYLDKYDYQTKCQGHVLKGISTNQIIQRSDHHLYNETAKMYQQIFDETSSCLPPTQCEEKVHFCTKRTQFAIMNTDVWIHLSQAQGYDPSFVMTSTPRIDDIDYVTFILGTLGTWLGFSFLAINPVPRFLQVMNDDKKRNTNGNCSHVENGNVMKEENESIKDTCDQRFARIESVCKKLRDDFQMEKENHFEERMYFRRKLLKLQTQIQNMTNDTPQSKCQ